METHKDKRHNRLARTALVAGALVAALGGIYYVTQEMDSKPRVHSSAPPASESSPAPKPLPRIEAPKVHAGLAASSDPQLRHLAQYETRLGQGFASNMLFIAMPKTAAEAHDGAVYLAPILKEYAKYNIEPMVVFEPEGIDLRSVDAAPSSKLFTTLKTLGVSDKDMGYWLPFPEPNIPEWGVGADRGNTDPSVFARNYNLIAGALKATYPEAKTMLLLDSASYVNHDTGYEKAPRYDEQGILQYTKGIHRNLVDAASLQGFMWGEKGDLNHDPGVFINGNRAVALARELDVSTVWLNTGTYSSMYDWEPSLHVTASNDLRRKVLQGIADEAVKVQRARLHVSVNIFAEDKRGTEANWSYTDPTAWGVFEAFAGDLKSDGIGLGLFDIPK